MASLEENIKQGSFASEQVKATLNVLYTAHCIHSQISALLKPYSLSHEQFNVLRILRGQHPNCLCQKDILSRMIAPNSNLTLIIKKLVSKKFITVAHSEKDKREYMISITEAGLGILGQIDKLFDQKQSTINALSVSEAFHLNALLDKLRAGS